MLMNFDVRLNVNKFNHIFLMLLIEIYTIIAMYKICCLHGYLFSSGDWWVDILFSETSLHRQDHKITAQNNLRPLTLMRRNFLTSYMVHIIYCFKRSFWLDSY